MVEPLITNNQNDWNQGGETSTFVANSFAKILWKKKFKKSAIQEHDDQIVSVVQEVYRPPEERKDEVWDWILDKDTSFLVHAAYKHRTENIVLICWISVIYKHFGRGKIKNRYFHQKFINNEI